MNILGVHIPFTGGVAKAASSTTKAMAVYDPAFAQKMKAMDAAGKTSVWSDLGKPLSQTKTMGIGGKVSNLASKSGVLGSVGNFLGKIPGYAGFAGLIAGAFEAIGEIPEIFRGFKEGTGRGFLQLGQSGTEVAGTTAGATAGAVGGAALGVTVGLKTAGVAAAALAWAGPVGLAIGGGIGLLAGAATFLGVSALGTKVGHSIGENVGTAVFGENKADKLAKVQKDMRELGLTSMPQYANIPPQMPMQQPQMAYAPTSNIFADPPMSNLASTDPLLAMELQKIYAAQ